jgi:hypothetical protein
MAPCPGIDMPEKNLASIVAIFSPGGVQIWKIFPKRPSLSFTRPLKIVMVKIVREPCCIVPGKEKGDPKVQHIPLYQKSCGLYLMPVVQNERPVSETPVNLESIRQEDEKK